MPKKWDRRETESTKAWEAFVTYRDLGFDRSAGKVAVELGKSTTIIERWCTAYDWVKRATAYDTEIDRRRQAAKAGAIEDMERRHAELGQQMQRISKGALNKLETPKAKKLATSEARRLGKTGADIERTALGQPDTIVAAAEPRDLSRLSADDLKTMKRLNAKARGEGDKDG